MNIIHTVAELRTQVSCAKAAGKQVGLVPDHGGTSRRPRFAHSSQRGRVRLHGGQCLCQPTQFNDPNDLKNYPRTLEADCALIEALGADIVFAPTAEEMYPRARHARFLPTRPSTV